MHAHKLNLPSLLMIVLKMADLVHMWCDQTINCCVVMVVVHRSTYMKSEHFSSTDYLELVLFGDLGASGATFRLAHAVCLVHIHN